MTKSPPPVAPSSNSNTKPNQKTLNEAAGITARRFVFVFGKLKMFVRFVFLFLFWIGLLSACGVNTPTTLEFELIEEGESLSRTPRSDAPMGENYTGETPDFLVIISSKSIDEPGLNVRFPVDLREKFLGIDYREQFIVVIFRGTMGSIFQSPLITVESVSWNGVDEIRVDTVFRDTSRDPGALPMLSSPYYIAAVDKPIVEGQDVRFVLQSDGEVVAEQTVYFP